MANLFDEYEQEFNDLLQGVQRDFATLAELSGEKRKALVLRIENNLDAAEQNLRSMEMEALGVSSARDRLKPRVDNYKKELSNMRREFRRVKSAASTVATRKTREELLEEGTATSDDYAAAEQDHRQRLLDGTRRLEQSSDHIQRSLQISHETEQIGGQILGDLYDQRQTIERTRQGLRDTNANVKGSRKLLSIMGRRDVLNKIILVAIILGLIGVIGIIVFFIVRPYIAELFKLF